MGSYRLSIRARSQIVQIYEYTESQFGAYQAEAYASGLIRTFELLADFPAIGQSAEDFRRGLRRFRFQAHVVYYTVSVDVVEIRGVLHHARQIRSSLFD
ncbi:type II toxin-antitoxin system RelE/ParE family toxin [Bradyrhizobium sp. HKCCYLS20291]|uniref:type II toxin-antitoxin system RelE/ParE family toxin n=1 Tax=Bradyrhizobium sp. HKCCYLS20291 TaxID=3420766 RepID=UPI003EBF0B12